MVQNKQTFDKEKVHFNLIKYQKHGKTFELAVDPDLAIKYKKSGKRDDEVLRDLLKSEKVFEDVSKGLLAPEENIILVFKTNKFFDVANRMILEGEIQLTAEYREKLRDEKRRKIVQLIHRSAINPQTNTPHPLSRIEGAILEAKVKVDELKKAEDQVQEILAKLKLVIPIKFDEKVLTIHLPLQYAAKLHTLLQSYGKMEKENWLPDGSFMCKLRIPAGISNEVFDELNSKTHGAINIEIEWKGEKQNGRTISKR